LRTGPGITPSTSAEPPSMNTTVLMRPRVARRSCRRMIPPNRATRSGLPFRFRLASKQVLGPSPVMSFAWWRAAILETVDWCLTGRVGCTARSRIPCGCGPFLCSLPPNPACTFQRTGLSSDLCRVRDRVCVDPVISCRARGERQVPLRLPALRIPHGSLIVHRLCPFALWTVISGLQIGRTLPRRLIRALRRHRTRVP